MFGSAYVVDVISEEGQHFDSGIIGSKEEAERVYEQICDDELEVRPLPEEFTVRIIKNGEVIRFSNFYSNRRG